MEIECHRRMSPCHPLDPFRGIFILLLKITRVVRTEVSILNFSITDLKRHETFIYREKRERELEGFMNKKYNRLGNKIQQRINNMNSLKTNRDLVLE